MKMSNMTTFDECKKVYKKYCQYKETAEQSVYPLLAIYDYWIEPLWKDLQENFTEEHGSIWLNVFTNIIFPKLGIK